MKNRIILLSLLLLAGIYTNLPAQGNLCISVSTPDHHGIPTTPPPPPLRFPPDCNPAPIPTSPCFPIPTNGSVMDHIAYVIPLDVYYTEFIPTNGAPMANGQSIQTSNGLVKFLGESHAIEFDIYPEDIEDQNGAFALATAVPDPHVETRMYLPNDPEPYLRKEVGDEYNFSHLETEQLYQLHESSRNYAVPYNIGSPTIYSEITPLSFSIRLLNSYFDTAVDGGTLRTWHAGFDVYLDLIPASNDWALRASSGEWKLNLHLANYPDSYKQDPIEPSGPPIYVPASTVLASEPVSEIAFQVGGCPPPRLENQSNPELKNEFTLSPNPFENVFHLSGQWIENGSLDLSLISMNGKKIDLGQVERVEKAGLSQEFSAKIDKSELASGIYVLNISCEGKTLESVRLVKQ